MVSIHAPARGATINSCIKFPWLRVSIHAPARGATRNKRHSWALFLVSIHAPARGATRGARVGAERRRVSIHAPARGATRRRWPRASCAEFQSTPLREGRHCCRPARPPTITRFNPRPCARGDADPHSLPFCPTCFNPRPCARGDGVRALARHHGPVSIHAPARGATRRLPCTPAGTRRFNPRPCARGDAGFTRVINQAHRFNPRPCARGDSANCTARGAVPVSIHAPARGATKDRVDIPMEFQFQSTPLREGRPTRCS